MSTQSTAVPAVEPGWRQRIARFLRTLNRKDRTSLAGMYGFIIVLHLIGFGILFGLVVPYHYHIGSSGVFDVGVGVLAYTFGLRHAFDVDHIAAIDNTTRKLMEDAAGARHTRKPLSVGF